MATNLFSVKNSDGWVEVAADSEDFLLENKSSSIVHVTYQTTSPSLSETAYHTIVAGESMVRTGTGNVYVLNPESGASTDSIVLAVTT